MVSPATRATIHYPSTDGEPVAETFFHYPHQRPPYPPLEDNTYHGRIPSS